MPDRASRVVRVLLLTLITAEALMLYDHWRTTVQGQVFLARAHAKLKGCTSCAGRRAKLRAMVNRVHWDAQRIVEGEDVPTVPEP